MGSLFVIIAGSLWGAMGIFVRGLSQCGLTSIEICLVRMVVATLMMSVYFLVFDRTSLKIKAKDIWVFIGTGVFSLTFFGYCYFTTIQMMSMSVAAVLLYTSPVFVLVLSALLFKEKLTNRKILCVIIAIVGCAFVTGLVSGIISGNMGGISVAGILFGLGSGLGYGLYSIFGRYAINKGYGPLTITFYSFLFSAIALLFITKPATVYQKLAIGNVTTNMAYVIGTAIVVTILPYIFYTVGLTKIENSKAAVMACVEPIMATFFGFIVFHEILSLVEIIGVVLVLLAIGLLNLKEGKG